MNKSANICVIDDVIVNDKGAKLSVIQVDRVSPQALMYLFYEVESVHKDKDGKPFVKNWSDVRRLLGCKDETCKLARRSRGSRQIDWAKEEEVVEDIYEKAFFLIRQATSGGVSPEAFMRAVERTLLLSTGEDGVPASKLWRKESRFFVKTNFFVETIVPLEEDCEFYRELSPLVGWLAGALTLDELKYRREDIALEDFVDELVNFLEAHTCSENPFPPEDAEVCPDADTVAVPAHAVDAPSAPDVDFALSTDHALETSRAYQLGLNDGFEEGLHAKMHVEDADAGSFATVAEAVEAMGRLRADSSDAGARRSAIARRVSGADSPTGNPPQWHALVKAFMRASDLRNGLKVACKALETYPDNIELVADAINCSKVGEWELGLSCIEEAWRLGVDTWNPDTAIAIGVFYKYYVDSGNVKPQERSWTIDKGIFAHEKYRQETNDRNDRALHAEAELLMKKRDFVSERKLLEGVIFPSDEEEVDEGEVFPQCCYRYFEDFLKDGGDSELMVKVCDKGIDGSKITGGRTAEEGYFHYHKACALDRLARKALEDLNEDDEEVRKRAKKAVRLALNEYKKAYADDFNKPDWPRIHSYFDDLRSDALEEGMDVGDICLDVRADEEQAAREAVRRKAIFYLDAEI